MHNIEKQDVIVTKNLALGYTGASPIVTQINLNIHQGEFIGILGSNGSGKSTFLRALLGLIKPLEGQINILGTKQSNNTQIGYMPQVRSHMSSAHLSGRSLLEASYNGTSYGLPFISKEHKQEIARVIERVQATSFADRSLMKLSGGERQRIYLAQALLGKPRILLLDEPLSNLDPRFQETFITLLQEIQQEEKMTILFTAHDVNPLLHVMSRVLYFARGKAAIGNIDEVITSQKLSSLYGTPIEVIELKNRLFVLGEGNIISSQEPHHHD